MVRGLPGASKSTWTRRLAVRFHAKAVIEELLLDMLAAANAAGPHDVLSLHGPVRRVEIGDRARGDLAAICAILRDWMRR